MNSESPGFPALLSFLVIKRDYYCTFQNLYRFIPIKFSNVLASPICTFLSGFHILYYKQKLTAYAYMPAVHTILRRHASILKIKQHQTTRSTMCDILGVQLNEWPHRSRLGVGYVVNFSCMLHPAEWLRYPEWGHDPTLKQHCISSLTLKATTVSNKGKVTSRCVIGSDSRLVIQVFRVRIPSGSLNNMSPVPAAPTIRCMLATSGVVNNPPTCPQC